ncbi:TetR/AcrR family transcriptional regulator [Niastella sp. GCM10012298]
MGILYKKEHILRIAEQLFAEKGFDGTSVRDIAQLANVNIAMVSYYFGSKEKLIEVLIAERAQHTFDKIEALNKDQTFSPWEKIDRLVSFLVEKTLNKYYFDCIISQQYNYSASPVINELILKIRSRHLEQITKLVKDGQRKKYFKKVDIELTMATILGTVNYVANSKDAYCSRWKINGADNLSYHKKIAPRLKKHLKHMLRAHLDIKNEE